MKPYKNLNTFGVEIEYMIVDAENLNVLPIADEILRAGREEYSNELERGAFGWSNELAMHVLELKTGAPVKSLEGLAAGFQSEAVAAAEVLAPHGARLMPTAMHPWMDPMKEMKLWPHGNQEIYEAFNKIFDCRGHGWANLQSTHLNIGFEDEASFRKLHAAIRLLLPLLPALAASSPYKEGASARLLDTRLDVYRNNCARVPSVTGHVVPERVSSMAEYETKILQRMYADIKPHDPDNILAEEWLNARGAIARFDRGTIEIRVLDCQECPKADLALARFIMGVLDNLVGGHWSTLAEQDKPSVYDLEKLLLEVIRCGEDVLVEISGYAKAFGFERKGKVLVGDLLWFLFEETAKTHPGDWEETVRAILKNGCLSRRIKRRGGKAPTREELKAIYGELADCLEEGELFGMA